MKKYLFLASFIFVSHLGLAQCPTDPWTFGSHQDMVDFANLFPNCQSAYVFRFNGNGITDFSPLSYVESVANVQFVDNGVLTSLEGFENAVIGMLWVENCDALVNLSGVNLSDSDLDYLLIKDSEGLTSLNGLEALLTISGHVEITNNASLPFCAIQPVCTAIANPAVEVIISDNAAGCESVPVVAAACNLSVSESEHLRRIAVIPNPVSDIIHIEINSGLQLKQVTVFSVLGKTVLVSSEKSMDVSGLSEGIYFLQIETSEGTLTKKIVKQ